MASSMPRPMAFDGQYAAAQLWKLDASPLFKGRYFQLSNMLADYLMLPAFPSARMKAWAEQYDRMPHATFNYTNTHLLPNEDIPRHLSEQARVRCRGWRVDGEIPIYIYYTASVPKYLAHREEIFGATAPFGVHVDDCTTDEENAFLHKWWARYRCPYPYVCGRWNVPSTSLVVHSEVHPQLTAIKVKMKAHFRLWDAAIVHPPDDEDDIVYIERMCGPDGNMYTNVLRP